MASMGNHAEAEAAFKAALQSVAGFGLFLYEIIVEADLKVHVLDKDGRDSVGCTRLKAAVHKLLGDKPAPDQLAELAIALQTTISDTIDLTAILA